MREDAAVLITGASSGFGETTARLLAEKGMRVFGTSRRGAEAARGPIPFTLLPLDVRSDASVEGCVKEVVKRAGRIDALVNNAGYALAGGVEETSLEEAKAQFETNFFGPARMIRAVLPIMRGQGEGRIVNVASLAGWVGVPYHPYYAASKFALDGLSEALRMEMRRFGIHVSVIQPGDFKTSTTANRVRVEKGLAEYAPVRDRAVEVMAKSEQAGSDPRLFAECVLRILTSRRPRLRYRVGPDAVWVPRLRPLLPASVFEYAIRKNYKVDD